MNLDKMDKTYLVHSFHTKYCNEEQLWMYVCYFTLSCMFAKRSGFDIVLYTDDKGAEMLQYAPYDDVKVTLNNITKPHTLFFAYPKFHVLECMDKNQIHIDGDVFLKNNNLKDILKYDGYDCIVQSIEREYDIVPYDNLMFEGSRQSFINTDYPEWAKRHSFYMFNTGVLGFNNEKLKREFIDTYWYMAEQFAKKAVNCPSCPEIIIEQQFLMDLCEFKNCNVKTVIEKGLFRDGVKEFCNDIGYQHVIGSIEKRKKLKDVIKTINSLDKTMISNLVIIKNKIFNNKKNTFIQNNINKTKELDKKNIIKDLEVIDENCFTFNDLKEEFIDI